MFNPTKGPDRYKLDTTQATNLESRGLLIHDDRRLRSLFFDGRFLTAKDLTREQTYFLTRQADLCRAGGVGVVAGLRVRRGLKDNQPDQPDGTITITSGHGVTASGEIVVAPNELQKVRFDNIPEIERLDAAFGLSRIPREAARNRSGLYILALRPVEYTANPVASYPTSLGGARSVHDGDIIEAVALTLIPYPDEAAGAPYPARRARAAHDVFVRGATRQAPVDALPLAMIALDHGVLQWVDEFLVRREVGSEQSDFLGLGYAPQALREAHLIHYQQHLAEVRDERKAGNRSDRFAASEHFLTLPPVGPLPAAAIDPERFVEAYFPPDIDVELSVIPEDELGALIEESLFLPPIDLTLPGEQLASTSVLVLVPIPRAQMTNTLAALTAAQRAETVALRSAAPGLAKRLPGDALSALTLKWSSPTPEKPEVSLAAAAWSKVLSSVLGSGSGLCWYARRKTFPYKPALIGERIPEPDELTAIPLIDLLKEVTLLDEFNTLPNRATTLAIGHIHTFLTQLVNAAQLPARKQLFAGAAGEVLRQPKIDTSLVGAVSARYQLLGGRGTGLQALLAVMNAMNPPFNIPLEAFAYSLITSDLDIMAMTKIANNQLPALCTKLVISMKQGATLDEAYWDAYHNP